MRHRDDEARAYEDLGPEEALARSLDGSSPWRLVDVRTVEEFAQGHPAGSWNVPFVFAGWLGRQPNPDFVAAVRALFEPDEPLVMTCATGVRSRHACELLASAGFRRLANLVGGYHGSHDFLGRRVAAGWQARELPVETRAREGRSWQEVRARLEHDG